MIRFLLRSLGFVLLAAAFVGAVLDGARSIANEALAYTTLLDVASAVARDRVAGLQPLVERAAHPALWAYGLGPFLKAPAALVALVLGVLLLRLGQPPREPIGYAARR